MLKTAFICTSNQGKLSEFKNALHDSYSVLGISDIEALVQSHYLNIAEDSDHFLSNAFSKLFSALKLISAFHDEKLRKTPNITQIIVDDSGLCVPDLKFEPGVHSAYYAGYPRNDEKNNLKLMDQIKASKDKIKKDSGEYRLKAFFLCFLLKIDANKNFDFIHRVDPKDARFFENEDIISHEKQLLNQIDLSLPSGHFFQKIPAHAFCSKFPKDVFIEVYGGFCVGTVSTKQQQISNVGHGYDPLFYPKVHPDLSFASISIEEKNQISHRALAMQAFTKINP